MTTAKKLTKNSFFVLLSRVAEALFSLLVFANIARYLGIEGFGIYSFITAAIWILSPLLFLGLNQILARDVAQNPEKASAAIGNGMLLNAIMTLPVVIISGLIIKLYGLDATASFAILITLATFIAKAVSRNYFGVIIGYEDMKLLFYLTIIPRAAELFFIIMAITYDMGFISLFISSLLAEVLGVLTGIFLFKKHFNILRPVFKADEIIPLLKENLSIMVSLFLVEAFLYVNIFVLKSLSSNADIGLFQAPHKILTRLQIIPMSLFVSFLPVLSRLVSSKEIGKFNSLFSDIFKWVLIITMPVSFVGVAFSENIILILFGKEFFKASLSLQILLSAFPFLCLNTFCRYLLLILKKYRQRVISDSILVLINLIVSLILVPSYGFIGASYSTLIAIFIQLIINLVFLSGHLKNVSFLKNIFQPIVAGIVLYLPLMGLSIFNNIVFYAVAMIVFLVMLFVLKIFSAKDIQNIKSILRMRKGEQE